MSKAHSVIVKQRSQVPIHPGDRFGKLTVLGVPFRVKYGTKNRSCVVCQCDCGQVRVIVLDSLGERGSKSCGCDNSEISQRCNSTHGYARVGRVHILYSTWSGMKRRCLDPHDRCYVRYGGRGISVCPEWATSPETFIEWALAHGWERGLQIDRKDNNGNYTPDNCRFVTRKDNCRNRRDNRLVTAFGETKTMCEWAEDQRAKVGYNTLRDRLYALGWNPEIAITKPVRGYTWHTLEWDFNLSNRSNP